MSAVAFKDEGVMSLEEAEVLLGHVMEWKDENARAAKETTYLSALQEGADMVLSNPSFIDVFKVPDR